MKEKFISAFNHYIVATIEISTTIQQICWNGSTTDAVSEIRFFYKFVNFKFLHFYLELSKRHFLNPCDRRCWQDSFVLET